MRKLKTIALAALAMAAIAMQVGCSNGGDSSSPSVSPTVATSEPRSSVEATTPVAPSAEVSAEPTDTVKPSPETSASTEPDTTESAPPVAGAEAGFLEKDDEFGELVTGTYFTCRMPGEVEIEDEKTMDDEDFSDMGIVAKMYTSESDDSDEMYAVMEMDWIEMISSFQSVMDESDKQLMTESLLETFGGEEGATIVKLGDVKAIKAEESVLADYGMKEIVNMGGIVDVYLAYYDQAYLIIMYGGSAKSYNAENHDAFTSSFKTVGLTNDYISLGD